MEKLFREFYKSFYLHTGGYIPVHPLSLTVYPGDYFQVRNGNIIVLGNIFRAGIIDRRDVEFGHGIKLNAAGWYFSEAVKKSFSARGTGHAAMGGEFEYSKLILSFGRKGAFLFRANDPEALKIRNWSDLQQQLIIKLTQTCYSFRELYLVTETVTTSSWTLAIGGSENAELEIATEQKNFELVDIYGHESAKTIQSRDIEFYHREPIRRPAFFKAKKLQVQDDKTAVFISSLVEQSQGRREWAESYFDGYSCAGEAVGMQLPVTGELMLLDLLQANQLNPNTALDYFKWSDSNMDDVEKLFFTYGYNG